MTNCHTNCKRKPTQVNVCIFEKKKKTVLVHHKYIFTLSKIVRDFSFKRKKKDDDDGDDSNDVYIIMSPSTADPKMAF